MQDLLQNKNSQTVGLHKDISSRRMDARKALEGEERRKEREKNEAILFAKKIEEAQLMAKREDLNKKETERQKKKQIELEKQRHSRLQIIKDKAFEKKRSEDIRLARQEAFFKKIKPAQKKPNSSTVYDIRPHSEVNMNKDTPKVRRIRTYKNDITQTIKKQNSSIVQIANKEKAKEETRDLKIDPPLRREKSEKNWAGVIMLILILGISGVVAVYKFDNITVFTIFKKTNIVKQTNQQDLIPALITPDTEKNILIQDSTNSTIGLIIEELQSNSSSDTIKNIYLTKVKEINTGDRREIVNEVIGVQELLSIWINFIPERLSRSLNDDFMIGTYTSEKDTSSAETNLNYPFLILTTNEHSQAFAGMLEWEKTIHGDVHELFGLDAGISNNSNSFYDGIINGIDVRILNNNDNEIAIVYSFLTENIIAITTKVEALAQIIQRL